MATQAQRRATGAQTQQTDRRTAARDAAQQLGDGATPQYLAQDEQHEDPLDAELENSFPASDPPAPPSSLGTE